MGGQECVARLLAAVAGGPLRVCGEDLEHHGLSSTWAAYRLVDGGADYDVPWPCDVAKPASGVERYVSVDRPIRDEGLGTVHSTLQDLARAAMGVKPFEQPGMDARLTRIQVCVWDERGRIDRVEIARRAVSVFVRPRESAGLRLFGVVAGKNDKPIVEVRAPGTAAITLSEPVVEVDLGLYMGDEETDESELCRVRWSLTRRLLNFGPVPTIGPLVVDRWDEDLPETTSSQRASEADGSVAGADGSAGAPNELRALLHRVETEPNPQRKGDALEKLLAALFTSVSGVQVVMANVRTESEEIDLVVEHDGTAAFWDERPMILVEAKNWSSRCGKNEFVALRAKLENRHQRASLGFLVSWNGFAETVETEILRASRELLMVVPVDGDQVRRAVAGESWSSVLEQARRKVILT